MYRSKNNFRYRSAKCKCTLITCYPYSFYKKSTLINGLSDKQLSHLLHETLNCKHKYTVSLISRTTHPLPCAENTKKMKPKLLA